MKLTTKDVIKIIPLEKSLQDELVEQFDTMSEDKRFLLTEAVWDTYYMLFKLKLDENVQLALARAEKNQEKLDGEFYKRMREQTEKEMQENSLKDVETAGMDEARQAIEQIIREIKASKKLKLPKV